MKFAAAFYASARSATNLAQLAEQSGWDGIFLGDAIWCQDPMICLSAAAMVTNRIRLGTMVVPVPLRRPWKLASESVALDHLSNGRLTLGLGAGYLATHEIDATHPEVRWTPSTENEFNRRV
jgi:alkanesulfonate monooxygenase SsuD/methylene tetrahydromethanopterin reductase-like flavin-dependent oxidoreductase (luciferase family)